MSLGGGVVLRLGLTREEAPFRGRCPYLCLTFVLDPPPAESRTHPPSLPSAGIRTERRFLEKEASGSVLFTFTS